ncbi:uncharacterized protein [Eurosta solidaginis]|uniref:uncharacterized protein n=1 Tax=Eurosta solidaginis TaxID=178769 RepID=UPI003530A992
MKYAIIILCFVAAVTALPFNEQHRHIRDVSEIVDVQPQKIYLPPPEPQNIYLPPTLEEPQSQDEPIVKKSDSPSLALASATDTSADTEALDTPTEAGPKTAVLGESGYEYRAIRRLRLRERRDVSHLSLEYLPPTQAGQKLALNYLPPHLDLPQAMPQISNEYLPPVNEKFVLKEQTTESVVTEESGTEAPTTEVPTTEVTTTFVTTTQAPTTEAPTANSEPATTLIPTTDTPVTRTPILKEVTHEETAILADDGYHYRKPAVLPNLGEAPLQKVTPPALELQPTLAPDGFAQNSLAEPELAYLPPHEFFMVQANGSGEETYALLDDSNHYRVMV